MKKLFRPSVQLELFPSIVHYSWDELQGRENSLQSPLGLDVSSNTLVIGRAVTAEFSQKSSSVSADTRGGVGYA